jgi:hypothetical protein
MKIITVDNHAGAVGETAMSRNTLAMDVRWLAAYDQDRKPGLSPGCLSAMMLCFPLASVIWAGIIYTAAWLVH